MLPSTCWKSKEKKNLNLYIGLDNSFPYQGVNIRVVNGPRWTPMEIQGSQRFPNKPLNPKKMEKSGTSIHVTLSDSLATILAYVQTGKYIFYVLWFSSVMYFLL